MRKIILYLILILGFYTSGYAAEYSLLLVKDASSTPWNWGYTMGEFTSWATPIPMFKTTADDGREAFCLKLVNASALMQYKFTNESYWYSGWWGEGGKDTDANLSGLNTTFYAKRVGTSTVAGTSKTPGTLTVVTDGSYTSLYIKAPFTNNKAMLLTKSGSSFIYNYRQFDYTGMLPAGYLDYALYTSASATTPIMSGKTLVTTSNNTIDLRMTVSATAPVGTKTLYIRGEVTGQTFVAMAADPDHANTWVYKAAKGGTYNYYLSNRPVYKETDAVRTLTFVRGGVNPTDIISGFNGPMILTATAPEGTKAVYVKGTLTDGAFVAMTAGPDNTWSFAAEKDGDYNYYGNNSEESIEDYEGVRSLIFVSNGAQADQIRLKSMLLTVTAPVGTESVYVKGTLTNGEFVLMTPVLEDQWTYPVTKSGTYNYYSRADADYLETTPLRSIEFVANGKQDDKIEGFNAPPQSAYSFYLINNQNDAGGGTASIDGGFILGGIDGENSLIPMFKSIESDIKTRPAWVLAVTATAGKSYTYVNSTTFLGGWLDENGVGKELVAGKLSSATATVLYAKNNSSVRHSAAGTAITGKLSVTAPASISSLYIKGEFTGNRSIALDRVGTSQVFTYPYYVYDYGTLLAPGYLNYELFSSATVGGASLLPAKALNTKIPVNEVDLRMTITVTVPAGTKTVYIKGEVTDGDFVAMTPVAGQADNWSYIASKGGTYNYYAGQKEVTREEFGEIRTLDFKVAGSQADVATGFGGPMTLSVSVPAGTTQVFVKGEISDQAYLEMVNVKDNRWVYRNIEKGGTYNYYAKQEAGYIEAGELRQLTFVSKGTQTDEVPEFRHDALPKETMTVNVRVPEGTTHVYMSKTGMADYIEMTQTGDELLFTCEVDKSASVCEPSGESTVMKYIYSITNGATDACLETKSWGGAVSNIRGATYNKDNVVWDQVVAWSNTIHPVQVTVSLDETEAVSHRLYILGRGISSDNAMRHYLMTRTGERTFSHTFNFVRNGADDLKFSHSREDSYADDSRGGTKTTSPVQESVAVAGLIWESAPAYTATTLSLPVNQWNFISVPYDVDVLSCITDAAGMPLQGLKKTSVSADYLLRRYDTENRAKYGVRDNPWNSAGYAKNSFQDVTFGDSTMMRVGQGYSLFSDQQTIVFWSDRNGTSQEQTDKAIPLCATQYERRGVFDESWNLMGIPIDSKFTLTSEHFFLPGADSRALTVYCNKTDGTNGYDTYNTVLQSGSDALVMEKNSAFFIQSGNQTQARFNASGCVADVAPVVYTRSANVVPSFVELYLECGGVKDKTIFWFDETAALTGYELNRDAAKMFGTNGPQLYSQVDDNYFAINYRPYPEKDEWMSLSLKAAGDSESLYSIGAARIRNLDEYVVELTDKKLGKTVDLSQTTCTFTEKGTGLTGSDRFALRVRPKVITGCEQPVGSDPVIRVCDGMLYVAVADADARVMVFDVSGLLLINTTAGVVENGVNLSVKGTLVVRIVTENRVITQKIFAE